MEDGWAHHLLAALQLHLSWLQPRLTTNNYEVRVQVALSHAYSSTVTVLHRNSMLI